MKLPPQVLKLFDDLHRSGLEREEAEAKANPVKHRLSKTIRGGTGYTYVPAGKDGRGSRVRFCVSKNPNVAGYFLIWREIDMKKKTVRDQWDSTTNRRSALKLADRLAKEYKARA